MNSLFVLRYIRGYVSFTAEGGFAERFINLCTSNKIVLWDTSYIDTVIYSKCPVNSIGKLRKISRKSGVKLRFQKCYGLYADLKKQKDKSGLFMGIIFYIVFFCVMSSFVWTIDVSGNTNLPKEEIISLAENHGLSVGTFKPSFDEFTAANSLSQSNKDKISWCAFNIKGSKAVIEIREARKSLIDNSHKEPCNIISNTDGIIITYEVYEGIPEIAVGDAVKKGDLLINGISDNEDLSSLFVEADGKITGHINKDFSLYFSKTVKCKKISKAKNKYSLTFFFLKLPLYLSDTKNRPILNYESNLSYNKTTLPLSLKIITVYETESVNRSEGQVLLSALEKFSFESRKENLNALLLSEKPTIKESKDGIYLKNHWEALAFIGEKQKISVEN